VISASEGMSAHEATATMRIQRFAASSPLVDSVPSPTQR
jgi:hypothetical protein